MKRIVLTALLLWPLTGMTVEQSKKVYICNSKYATVYHADKECKGLGNCTHSVKELTLGEAQRKKRRACKICY